MIMSLVKIFRDRTFSVGYNEYLTPDDDTGLRFQILQMTANSEETIISNEYETALLIIEGKGTLEYGDQIVKFDRNNWIEQNPVAAHFPAGDEIKIVAEEDSRLAVISTLNSSRFDGKIYLPDEVDVERRGEDILDGTCYRLVRLVFDRTIAPENAKLVLGEVLNFPGKWSSYPPHHHIQPEIYYYEFSPQEGYGHGELGEDVFNIKHQDLLKITDSKDHSQVSAPGYHMYYIWAIRHLDDAPYTGFEFTKPFDKLLE